MTNFVIDAADDALLDYISTRATNLHVCSGSPLTRAVVITNTLGTVVIDGTDYTTADGDVSGRKDTLQQQAIASATASGTAHTVCIIDATVLLKAADLASDQAITSGNPITVNAHDHEVRDPT